MKFTLIRKVNGINHLLINQHGFPFMFEDEEEAYLEKIDQQLISDEPIFVHGTIVGEK